MIRLVVIAAWALLSLQALAAPPITAAAFTPDGKRVVTGSQAGIAIFTWPELESRGTLETKLANIHDLAFSPQGDVLLAAGGAPAVAGQMELLRWPEGARLATIEAGDDVVYAVCWRSDGSQLAAACGDRSVRLFDAQGRLLKELQGHSRSVLAVRFLNPSHLISAGRDQSVRLWDAQTGTTLRSLDNHTAAVSGLAVRPGIATAAPAWAASIGGDRTLRFWQPTIGRLVRFARLASEPLAVEWSADGALAVVACADGHVRQIDPQTAQTVRDVAVLDGWAYTLARSPADGSFVVAGQDGQTRRIALP